MPLHWRGMLVLAAALAGSVPADVTAAHFEHAEPGASVGAPAAASKVGVAPTRFDGAVTDDVREQLSQELFAGLRRGDFESFPLDPSTKGCETRECWRDIARAQGADLVLFTEIASRNRVFSVVLELEDVSRGQPVLRVQESCEICTNAEVRELLSAQTASLRSRIDVLQLGPPTIVVESNPAGALIELEGEALGTAPVERTVTPGKHQVRASKPGYVVQERSFTAVPGAREILRFELSPEQIVRRAPHARAWGWTLVALGTASVAAGATLLALDGREARHVCSGTDVDASGNCRFLYGTLAGGATATALGLAGTIVGAALLIARPDRRKARRTSMGAHGVTIRF